MKKFLFILFTLLSFISCNIDNSINIPQYPIIPWYWQPNQANGNGQYTIGGYVAAAPSTRAYSITASDVISDYSTFSLFGWAKDSVPLNNFHGNLSQEQGSWGYSEPKKYFDNNQDSYSFIGIIPQSDSYVFNNEDSTVNVNLTDFLTEGSNVNEQKYNKEFIVAKTTVEKSNYSTGATLAFEHQNSIVRIKFETNTGNNLEILDFTPHVDYQPAKPAVPGTETYTSKQVKFIDELVNGNEVQVGIGFVGSSSPKLTKNNPTSLYVGTNNPTYNYYAKDWLLSIKDAVNSQFVYYRLNAVANSTSKTETTEDWESAASNKNIFMMKLADGVNKTNFANGNDAFMEALTAHESDWVGGSPAEPFKAMFEQAYSQGWRVIRINQSDANPDQVLVFLSSNQNITTQVCEITGGSPATPEIPESGIANIIVLPATSENQTGKDAVLSTFPETVTAKVGLNGVSYTQNTGESEIKFTKPGLVSYSIYSPTNWYTFPIKHQPNFGFTIKFSYEFNGVKRYDARVFVPATKSNWISGKWYDYVIKINSDKHGKTDDSEADPIDPKIEEEFPINVSSSMDEYTHGETHNFEL